jgi:hypothetical protein
LTVAATGTWPGDDATIAASGSTTFTALAPLDGVPAVGQIDLAVDPATVPTLYLSGVMLGNDGPLSSMLVVMQMFAGPVDQPTNDDYYLTTADAHVTPNPVDGTYSFSQVMPVGTTHVEVTSVYGVESQDSPTRTLVGFHAGTNPFQHDVVYRPPVARVSGTVTGAGGAPLPGTYGIQIIAYDNAPRRPSTSAGSRLEPPSGRWSRASTR